MHQFPPFFSPFFLPTLNLHPPFEEISSEAFFVGGPFQPWVIFFPTLVFFVSAQAFFGIRVVQNRSGGPFSFFQLLLSNSVSGFLLLRS